MSDVTTMLTTPLKPIMEQARDNLGTKIRKNLTYAWYFEKPYEKLIMVLLNVLGLWKLIELIVGLF